MERIRTIELAAIILLWRSCPNRIREEGYRYIHPTLAKHVQMGMIQSNARRYVPLKLASVVKYHFRKNSKSSTISMRNTLKEMDVEEMAKLKAATRMNLYHRILWVIKLLVSEVGNRALVEAELKRNREQVPEDVLMTAAREGVLPKSDTVIEVSSEDIKVQTAVQDMEITIKQNAETPADDKAIVELIEFRKIHVPLSRASRRDKKVEPVVTDEMPDLEDDPPKVLENIDTGQKRSLASFKKGVQLAAPAGSQPVEQTVSSLSVTGGDRATVTQPTTSVNRNGAPTTSQQVAVRSNVGLEAAPTMSTRQQVASTADNESAGE